MVLKLDQFYFIDESALKNMINLRLRGRIENYNPSYLSKLDNIREPMDGPGRPFGSRKPCGVLLTSSSRPFSDGDMMVGMESGGGGASSPRSIPGSGDQSNKPEIHLIQ